MHNNLFLDFRQAYLIGSWEIHPFLGVYLTRKSTNWGLLSIGMFDLMNSMTPYDSMVIRVY